MKYVDDLAKRDKIFDLLSQEFNLEKSFDEGVLIPKKTLKFWLDFDSIFTSPFFESIMDCCELVNSDTLLLAGSPKSSNRYFELNNTYPIVEIPTNDGCDNILQKLSLGPELKGDEFALYRNTDTFIIFEEQLRWAIYCQRGFETAMMCLFDSKLGDKIKQIFERHFAIGYILNMDDNFDPLFYDYLTSDELHNLKVLYQ